MQRRWRDLRKIEQVQLQSVVMWHTVPWIFFLSWCALPVGLGLRHEPAAQVLGWSMIAVAALQCVQINRSLRRALDHYLGHAEFPRRDLALMLCLCLLGFGLALALRRVDGIEDGVLVLGVLFLITPYAEALGFALSIRNFFRHLAVLVVVLVAAFAAVGARGGELVGVGALVAAGGMLSLLTSRCGAWTLSVMWEAERARETESRLAVAEERLRFGRDLHDVMGRNLAVIALKSELAVQLARRGRPEAVDQMVEVQRIAQETQREIRDVVRGYREAELGAELAGAQGVLEAAGIRCRVTGANDPSERRLPPAVQAALGWVVREGTTNVLRHGDAETCAITVSVTEGRTELTIENDGAPEAPVGSGGSGLRGLRERLATVGGTLEHTSAQGRFRLTALVPLPETGRPDRTSAPTDAVPRTPETKAS
ncbi:sensor histidine kinase [Streptomyces flavofungini]|uniref:Sensor histidine kinase n=1 Tax=Streptomyces flavofungini TaxID=68200 RepID=A0ABS0XHB9_9ACTN|nr:histidine kinase [Streptomyces flavofungini]MBJ3812623.1 sensor histidine kinase [Streptomyces flavofungini]